jgi:hypothetical protein
VALCSILLLSPGTGPDLTEQEQAMSDQNTIQPNDDTEGHVRRMADEETPEGDDTQGHKIARADADTAEGGDTEGHMPIKRGAADEEAAEADDTEGHGFRGNADVETDEGDEGDDTEGHARAR